MPSEGTPLLALSKYHPSALIDRPNDISILLEHPEIPTYTGKTTQYVPLPTVASPGNYSSAPPSELTGYILVALAGLSVAANVIFVRLGTSQYNIPPITMVFFLSVVMTFMSSLHLLIFTPFTTFFSKLTQRQFTLITLRGTAGAITCILLYSAIKYISAGEADAIYFVTPAFTIALSSLILQEPLTPFDVLLSLISILGAFLVSSPSFGEQSSSNMKTIGAIFALTAAFLNAVGLVLVRSVIKETNYTLLVFSFGFCSLMLTTLLGGAVSLDFMRQNPYGTFSGIMCGFCGFLGQTFMHSGLNYSTAGRAALVRNCEVPFVYFLALMFLHERPAFIPSLGSALVVGSAVLLGLRQLFKRK